MIHEPSNPSTRALKPDPISRLTSTPRNSPPAPTLCPTCATCNHQTTLTTTNTTNFTSHLPSPPPEESAVAPVAVAAARKCAESMLGMLRQLKKQLGMSTTAGTGAGAGEGAVEAAPSSRSGSGFCSRLLVVLAAGGPAGKAEERRGVRRPEDDYVVDHWTDEPCALGAKI
jgi:hypothetical protein